LSETQADTLIEYLSPYPGQLEIRWATTGEASDYANDLMTAFRKAGWTIDYAGPLGLQSYPVTQPRGLRVGIPRHHAQNTKVTEEALEAAGLAFTPDKDFEVYDNASLFVGERP
jgi:hypothetical protein